MSQVFLVLDVGTTGVKAALMSAQGKISKTAYRDYSSKSPQSAFVEQNAEDWWQAALEVAAELNLAAVTAIAITGQMQNLVLLNSAQQPVRPVILYSDMRALAEAEFVNHKIGTASLTALTGNIQTASSVLAKLVWLKNHEPETLAKTTQLFLGAADYLAFKLTSKVVTDMSTASTTGLMNIDTRAYLDEALFESVGLGSTFTLLPQLLAGGSKVANVSLEASKQLGLSSEIGVYLGPGDAVATTLGVGSGELTKPYAYIGTSGWLAYSSTAKGDPNKGVFTLAHIEEEQLLCIAPLLTAGANFDWIKTLTGQTEHSSMIDAAVAKPISKLIYLPYLNGERSPFSDPFARGSFIGLSSSHDKHDLARAVLEGVAFAYRHALESLLAEAPKELRLTGGGARSEAFCQLLADIVGIKVTVLESSLESGLLGTLISTRLVKIDSFPVSLTLNPNLKLKSTYDQNYAWFLQAYASLKPLFAEIAQTELKQAH